VDEICCTISHRIAASLPWTTINLFKALVREFFADFLQLFFAEWAARFDLSTIQWNYGH